MTALNSQFYQNHTTGLPRDVEPTAAEAARAIAPVLPSASSGEQALKVFYNPALTPWLVPGAGLQVLDPAWRDDTAAAPAVRLLISL